MDPRVFPTILMVALFVFGAILAKLLRHRAFFMESLVYAIAASIGTAWLIILEMQKHDDVLVGVIVLFALASTYFWNTVASAFEVGKGKGMNLRLRLQEAEELFGVTKQEFERQRDRRFGTANPDPMDVPFWHSMIRTGASPYVAKKMFGAKLIPEPPRPVWCFDRFGMSRTILPGGMDVFIGGEHEDGCDPDFCIYNDVIVRGEEGETRIFGYPRYDFPPTDFHTATYVERLSGIIVIGGLGYKEDRIPGITNVFTLFLDSYYMKSVETSGENPSWIWEHYAVLSLGGEAIVVYGGKVLNAEGGTVDNTDVYRLTLASMKWDRVSEVPIGEVLR